MILYEGPSLLDGKQIVAIATAGSRNTKTGPMIQTWILAADSEPHTAQKSGADDSVCGDCPARPSLGGDCYVLTMNAPLSVYRAWQRGKYSGPRAGAKVSRAIAAGAGVRLGAYGDPSAVPPSVWRALIAPTATHTGYTHQWQGIGAAMRDVLMASADTAAEARHLHTRGWRTFRVLRGTEAPLAGEIQCPADLRGTQCAACGLCNGSKPGDTRRSIYIAAHGARSKTGKITPRLLPTV